MSTQYPYLYQSHFPDGLDEMTEMTDPTEADLPKIEAYNAKIAAKDWAGAQQVLAKYPELKNMMFDADRWNSLYHMTYAVQEFFHDNIDDYLENLVTYQGSYSSSKTYAKYDVVEYGGLSYMAIAADIPKGTPPTDSSCFVRLTITGPSGLGLSFCGAWSSTVTYKANDCVELDNTLWAATASNTNSKPSAGNTNWNKVLGLSKQIVVSSTEPASQSAGDIWYKIV